MDLVAEFDRTNPGLRFRKKMVIIDNLGECIKGFHVVQVDVRRFSDGVISLGCVVRNHEKEVV